MEKDLYHLVNMTEFEITGRRLATLLNVVSSWSLDHTRVPDYQRKIQRQ